MNGMNNDMRTPLGKVRGLGSAKEGTGHFWYQRLSAVALVPLVMFSSVWSFRSMAQAMRKSGLPCRIPSRPS